MKNIDDIFVSALYYGINKAIEEVLGDGGKVLSRRASHHMIELLKEMNLLKENMSNEEIRDLFTNTFGLAKDLLIEDNGDEVTFTIVNPTLDVFLKKLKEEDITPHVCPFVFLLSRIYEETHGVKLMLKQVVSDGNNMKLIFKKIK